MSFFGIGTFEFFTILIIALLIFGPGRLPELMGDAGRMLRDFRRYSQELTGDFQESVREVRETYDELESDVRGAARDIQRDTNEIARSVNETAAEATRLDTDVRTSSRRRQGTGARRRPAASRADESQPLDQAEMPDTLPAEDRLQSESPAPVTSSDAESARKVAKPVRKQAAQDDLLSVDDEVDDLLSARADSESDSAAGDSSDQSKPTS